MNNEPTSEQQAEIDHINAMSREEMCRLWRFAPVGHPYFDITRPYAAIFKERFELLGGFSPAMQGD